MSIAKSGADVTAINNGSLIIFNYFATRRTNREYPTFSNTLPLGRKACLKHKYSNYIDT